MIDSLTDPGIEPVRKKTIALASGKGGVGKTTTAANLAVYYARKGLNTGIIDLDPLSDIASLFDLTRPGETIRSAPGRDHTRFEDLILPVCKNLDLLLPDAKLGRLTSAALIRRIYSTFRKDLESRYDLILLDLPAGENYEDNIMFIPLAGILIVVTNPEPTAHVSAGGYMKKVFEYDPDRSMWVWHNKYEPFSSLTFSPSRLADNYNRNVLDEMHLSPEEMSRIRDIAFIPPDPSLDLLKTDPGFTRLVLRKMIDLLSYLMEKIMEGLTRKGAFSPRVMEVLTYYVNRNPAITDVKTYIRELGNYLKETLDGNTLQTTGKHSFTEDTSAFTLREQKELSAILGDLKGHQLRRDILRTSSILEKELTGPEASEGRRKTMDRELTQLLMKLNAAAREQGSLKNPGGLFLFYFALLKLLQTESFSTVLNSFIPRKKTPSSGFERDRYRQIKNLIERDKEYRKAFLELLKTIYPIMEKQLTNTVSVLNIPNLLFTDDHKINNKAYAKLLTTYIHDAVYSGLGIIIGFEYRSAALAFGKGAEKILAVMDR